MHPLTLILSAVIAIGGIVGFVLLPLDLPIRLAILGSDLVAAVVLCVVFARRQNPK